MLLHHALQTESAREMLPLVHVASKGSDEPAHPHSLARDIAAHIHNESVYSPTRWLCIIHRGGGGGGGVFFPVFLLGNT